MGEYEDNTEHDRVTLDGLVDKHGQRHNKAIIKIGTCK